MDALTDSKAVEPDRAFGQLALIAGMLLSAFQSGVDRGITALPPDNVEIIRWRVAGDYEVVPALIPYDASRVARQLHRQSPAGMIDLDLDSGI